MAFLAGTATRRRRFFFSFFLGRMTPCAASNATPHQKHNATTRARLASSCLPSATLHATECGKRCSPRLQVQAQARAEVQLQDA